MPSPILARADALMQRRRQNLAENEEIPVLTDALDDDDIPILLEADMESLPTIAESLPVQEPEIPPSAPVEPAKAGIDPARLESIISELTDRIEQRLATELPNIIEATVREFLSEQKITDNAQTAA